MMLRTIYNVIALLGIALLFYFGGYTYFSSRESSAWHYEYIKSLVKNHPDADTVIIGDSTAGNDFRTNYYNRHSKHKAILLGMPGSWYLSLEKLAVFARKDNKTLDTVVVFLGPDTFLSNRVDNDILYSRNSLSTSDIVRAFYYSDSFSALLNTAGQIAFRPFLFQNDLQDFINHGGDRLRHAPESYAILTRTGSSTDLFYEEEKTSSVCNAGDMDRLDEKLERARRTGDKGEQQRLEIILASYKSRKGSKIIDPSVPAGLDHLLEALSSQYQKVYVVNSPVYAGLEVYPAPYIGSIETLTRSLTKKYSNISYIEVTKDFTNDCSNFMDVVHMNAAGGEKLTNLILEKTKTDTLSLRTAVSTRPNPPTAKIVLKDFGPDTVEANRPFNVQPNGMSAVWAACENATPSTVIVLNGIHLKSSPHADGKLVTALVPKDLISKEGGYSISLLDERNDNASNAMTLVAH